MMLFSEFGLKPVRVLLQAS